jgi:hypothetical protein
MTKYEIIKALAKCKPSEVYFLSVVYHNTCDCDKDTIHYEFVYDSHSSVATEKAKDELLKVIQSVYKMRKYVVYIACSCNQFQGKFFDVHNRFYIMNSISDFIRFSTKK